MSVIISARDGSENDQKWYAASRHEFATLLKSFSMIRNKIHSNASQYKIDLDPIEKIVNDPCQFYDANENVRKQAADTAQVYGNLANGMAAITTAASTSSFTAGPIIGIATTATTAVASFGSAGYYTLYKVQQAKANAIKAAEDLLRNQCNLPPLDNQRVYK